MKRLVPALSRMVLFLMLLAGCGGGASGGGTSSTGDSITIVSVTPSTAVAGNMTSFTIQVSYDLRTKDNGYINIGLNKSAVDSWDVYDGLLVSKGTGSHMFVINEAPVNWGAAGNFQVVAFIMDAAVSSGSDLAHALKTIIVTASGADSTAPTVPSGLITTPTSSSQINLAWAASTDAVGVTGYKVYRDGTYLKSTTTVSAIDSGLTASTQYCYQVSSYDAAGNESNKSSQACAVTQISTSTGFTGNFLSWTGSSDSTHSMMLVRVNGQTGTVTTIGGSNFFTGLGYGADGKLYGVSNELHIVNPANGATTKIGDLMYLASNILMKEAAFSPDGKLYVVENGGDRVFTVNLTTGALTLMGTVVSTVYANGLEFSTSGTLYTSFADLYTLNSSDMSTISTLGNTGGVYISKLTFGSGEVLFGMDIYDATHIYSLNLSTGLATAVTPVSSIGLNSLVAERTTTVYPAPKVKTEVVNEPTVSSHDIESLLNMENEIKAHYLLSK